MPRFAADENFNNDILRVALQLKPDIDLLRIQDSVVAGAQDPSVLEWAASESRILLTHDANTIPKFAYERVENGLPMPGVLISDSRAPVVPIAQDIVLIAEASGPDDWNGQVRYLPLR